MGTRFYTRTLEKEVKLPSPKTTAGMTTFQKEEMLMAVIPSCSADGKVCTIKVSGIFDFKVHRDFRNAYEHVSDALERYIVDLREAEYIDSSALGMLLILRKHAAKKNATINIANCSTAVRPTLEVANFHKLFQMT